VHEAVAAFLRERDGADCDASDVFLTDGASAGVRMLMQVACRVCCIFPTPVLWVVS
jgi:aspartate/methionine/tyrosine aminotransferase